MDDMPTGRLRMRIRAVHTKRERRGRQAAKVAHEHLLALNEYAMEMMELGADARSTQERGVAKPKREVMN
jgi:hypothetical protein